MRRRTPGSWATRRTSCARTWVGFDDAIPLGWGEAGATTALPAWIDFMKAAHDNRPVADFPRPAGVLIVKIDPGSGLLARADQEDAVEEEFLDGTAPTEQAAADAGSDAAATEVDDAAAPPDPEAVQAGSLPGPKGPEALPATDAGATAHPDAAPEGAELPPF